MIWLAEKEFLIKLKSFEPVGVIKRNYTTLQGLPLKGKWGIPFIKEFTIKPTPEVLNNFIRAMQPWPGAWTIVNIGQDVKDKGQRRLKILNSHLSQPTPHNQQLVIDKVQLEGKDLITWIQFTQGYPKSKFE